MTYARATSTSPQDVSMPRILVGTLVAASLLLPILSSTFFFADQSVRLDEAQSLWQTSRGFVDIITVVAGDVHVPLYHLLLRAWRLLVGDSMPLARLLSLVLYLVAIPLFYLLGARAYNRRVALVAVGLFALSPFMHWYGNEIRMYTLFTLLVILNQYCFIRLFQDRVPSDHIWAGYIGTALLGIFTHYFFFLNLLAQGVFVMVRRPLFSPLSRARFFFAGGVIALAMTPWVWYVFQLGLAAFQEPVLAQPSSVDLFSTFSQFLFGFQNDNINKFFLSLWPIVVILKLFSLRRSRRHSPETEYFMLTLVLSFSVAFVGSFLTPMFVSRYLIFTIPSFYLLLASFFDTYPRRMRTIAYGALMTTMAVALVVEIVSPTTPVRENYSEAVAYITAHATVQDTIILSAPFTIYPVQYYYRGSAPIVTLPLWNQYAHGPIPPFATDELPAQVERAIGSSQNVYVVLSYDQGYEADIKAYFDSHYEKLNERNFSRGLTVYVYRARYDTTHSAIGIRRRAG